MSLRKRQEVQKVLRQKSRIVILEYGTSIRSGGRMKKGKKYRIIAWVVLIFFLLLAAALAAWFIMIETGRMHLQGNATSKMPNFGETADQGDMLVLEEYAEWQEDWIRYNGQIYDFNEDILTFLFMGIDVQNELSEKQTNRESGQADALFLCILNPTTKQIIIIGIDRNTMTTYNAYDDDGNYVTQEYGQITLAHSYGDGRQLSAENTVRAVSQLLFDIPIHGYCALNMAGVSDLNDAVGGVEVTALDDIPRAKIKKGEQIHLMGSKAYDYVQYRDVTVDESARGRLQRQKQYLTAYISQAKGAIKANPTITVQLYQLVTPYITTDVTVDELVYLAQDAAGYEFTQENIHIIPGVTDVSGRFEEFHPDEEAMKKLIIDVYYTPVED
jgi:LCP family protein required for cell wall assembly